MLKIPQPIPYQGSKRLLAPLILSFFPNKVGRLVEPFSGSAAISVAASIKGLSKNFLINDVNRPLIQLIKEIVDNPERTSNNYKEIWRGQLGNEKEYFAEIRSKFNQTQSPDYLLYILARCIKGAVRYNSNGEFNQSADNRRLGREPERMKKEILALSAALKGKTTFHNLDYKEIIEMAEPGDIFYMDPPYQGTSVTRDQRYFSQLNFSEFVASLERLVDKDIPFLISYDGKTGEKTYGKDLPSHLGLHKVMLEAGRSTQSTLLGKTEITYEALYLSSNLTPRVKRGLPVELALKPQQLNLL